MCAKESRVLLLKRPVTSEGNREGNEKNVRVRDRRESEGAIASCMLEVVLRTCDM